MALTPQDVSKVRIGKLTEYSISYLLNLKKFFNVTFKITPDYDTNTVLLTCVGSGFKNFSKKTN
jgi:RNA 3'-terminal phosphate cyclase-like protein